MAGDSYRLSFTDESIGALKKALTSEQKKSASSTSIDLSSKSNSEHLASSNSKTDTSISLSSAIASQVSLLKNITSSQDVINNSDIFTEDAVKEYDTVEVQNRAPVTLEDATSSSYSKIENVSDNSLANINSKYDYSKQNNNDTISDNSSLSKEIATALAYSAVKDSVDSLIEAQNQDKYSKINSSDEVSSSLSSSTALSSLSDGNSATSSSGGKNPYSSILDTIDEAVSTALDSDSNDIDINIGDDYAKKKKIKTSSPLSDLPYDEVEIDLDEEERSLTNPPSKYDELVFPDAMSNMYDAYFRIVENDGESDKAFATGSGVLDILLNSNLLSARISSISIPSRVRESTSINLSGTSYDRQTDVITDPGKSSFTIRGDTRLYYVDVMNELSGTAMGSIFGKGSALLNGLSSSALVEIDSKMKEEINAAEDIMKTELEKANENYQNDLTKIRTKLISDAAYSYDGVDELDMIKKALDAVKNDPAAYSATLREMSEKNAEQYIVILKNKQKAAIDEAKSQSTDKFKALNEAMKEKKAVQKQIDAIEEALKKAHKQEKEAMKKFSAAVKEIKEKQKNEEKDAKSKARKAAANIEFSIDTGEALAYITSAISKNMQINVKPAESIDDLKNKKRLDIVVKRTSAGPRFHTELTEKKDERFVFEDVRLLGTSDAISFSRETTDIQEFTYDFIYKRCYKIDLYDTTKNWVASQIKQFVNSVISN